MSDFLPDGYSVPSSGGNYMKLKPGENRFRFLSSPIVGWEWWEEGESGRKPIRVRKQDKVPVEFADEVRHFWAMVVWNYDEEKIQVLELTQKKIMNSITGISRDSDWGSPVGINGYDFVITREGEGMETRYEVRAKPKREIEAGIVQLYKDMNIKLEALYDSGDPFSSGLDTGKIADEVFSGIESKKKDSIDND